MSTDIFRPGQGEVQAGLKIFLVVQQRSRWTVKSCGYFCTDSILFHESSGSELISGAYMVSKRMCQIRCSPPPNGVCE